MHLGTRLVSFLRPAARRIAVSLGKKSSVRGLAVVDLVLGDPKHTACAEVADAIELIFQHDPLRVRRMARDIRFVVVTRTAETAGEYWEDIRSVLLDADNVQKQTKEAIAMVIVHEATHARLWRMGVGSFPDRERIERICVMAEIAFAKRVTGTERLIVGAEAKLTTRYWETSREQDVQRYLKSFGFPRWVRRLLGSS